MSNPVATQENARIWIDLDNSPHVPFFAPIIAELEKRGYSVFLTARDCFQVSGLIDLMGLNCKLVGRHYGKNKLAKLAGLCFRAGQLTPLVLRAKPSLALSHGSRAQLIVSSLCRIPSLMIDDYEFSQQLPFAKPRWVMIPEVIQDSAVRHPKSRLLKYPGIKEDVYVPGFKPEPSIKELLGLNDKQLVVTVRPPADEAHYHTPESDQLFRAALDLLAKRDKVKVIFLPRSSEQAKFLRIAHAAQCTSGKFLIPERALDGLNVIWHSDIVISGGGTMNREAAALGIPVYSTFRGKIGAVDRYLAAANRLVLLESVADVQTKIKFSRRSRNAGPVTRTSESMRQVVDNIVAVIDAEKAHHGIVRVPSEGLNHHVSTQQEPEFHS